jgi:Amt family ammonium transporter
MIGELVLQTDVTQVAESVNAIWVLVASFMVFLMQPGFALLEAGQVRAKNVANVTMKNLMDWSLGVLTYFVIGLGIATLVGMATSPGPISIETAFAYVNDPGAWINWLFGAVFAMTAATIVSGAVTERISFGAYVAFAVVVTTFIYPVAQGLVWQGGLLSAEGYLGQLLGTGYIDFAGGTVVHMVGGIAGLTAAAIVGPRLGRFDEDGNTQPIPGHSVFLALLGTLVLAFGWYGFNVGTQATVLTADGEFMGSALGRVALTTTLAMGAGAVASALITMSWRGTPDPLFTANGLLGGLVAITSGAAAVTWWGAIAIGAIGGGLVMPTFQWVLRSLSIDDVCGVFAVHGAAGGLGALLIPLFAVGSSGTWAPMGPAQFAMQAVGVLVLGTWTVLATITALSVIGLVVPIRVSEDDERDGLDAAEHNMSGYPEFNVVRESGTDEPGSDESSSGDRQPQPEPTAPTSEASSSTMWRGEEVGGDEGAITVVREAVVNSLSIPAFVLAEGGEIKHVNDDARTYLQPRPDGGAEVGLRIDEFPGLDDDTRTRLEAVVEEREPLVDHETTIENGDGMRDVRLSSIPIERAGHIEALTLFSDVTEKKAARLRDRRQIEYRDEMLSVHRQRLERLADGDLDVDSGVPEPETDFEVVASTHEEFGALDSALSTVASNVYDIVERLPDQSTELASRSESLNDLSADVRSKALETDELTGEITEEVDRMAAQARDASEIVEDQTTAIEQISASTTEISDQSREATSLTDEAVDEVQDAVGEIRAATEVSGAVKDDIETLDERMAKVENIVTVINDIADQTNILALNASIEAARAGKEGEGFAVVADEVKALAEETQDQADDIARIISELKSDTTSAVDSIQQANEQVTSGADSLIDVVDTLETAREHVVETNSGIEEISDAADGQARDATKVRDTIEDLSDLALDIDQQVTRISDNVDEQTNAVATVSETADELQALAGEMDENVDAFSTEVRQEVTTNG